MLQVSVGNYPLNRAEGGLRTKGLFKKKSEKRRPLVSIVTPVYNGEKYLEETIQSVLGQTYGNIEYIIVDGGSSDRTLSIIRKYENKIAYWVSEPDKGVYDAINKGFRMATGEILAWLNADDKYYHSAIEIVARVFTKYPEIQWITGIPTFYDKKGLIVSVAPPIHYFRKFLRMGLYRQDILGTVQQESTFWRRTLWEPTGELCDNLQLAGDYDLWIRFSKHARLRVVPTILGGFREHPTQKTRDMRQYYAECHKIKCVRLKGFWRMMRFPIRLSSMLIASYPMYKMHGKNKRKEILD